MIPLTPGELAFIRLLWADGEMKPNELQARFAEPIKNPTLRSYLTILVEKGHVTRDPFVVECDPKRGTVWFGSKRSGLHRASPDGQLIGEPLDMKVRNLAISPTTGDVWVATDTSALRRDADAKWSRNTHLKNRLNKRGWRRFSRCDRREFSPARNRDLRPGTCPLEHAYRVCN